MSMQDPISDMLTRVRNAQMAGKKFVDMAEVNDLRREERAHLLAQIRLLLHAHQPVRLDVRGNELVIDQREAERVRLATELPVLLRSRPRADETSGDVRLLLIQIDNPPRV